MLTHFDREKAIYNSSLRPNERFILLVLNTGGNEECEHSSLSRMTGMPKRTVDSVIARLLAKRILVVATQSSARLQLSRPYDIYDIDFSLIPEGKVKLMARGKNEHD